MKLIELLRGKPSGTKIRHISSVNTVVYKTPTGKICKVSSSTSEILMFTVRDFLANDWIVVDDWRGN